MKFFLFQIAFFLTLVNGLFAQTEPTAPGETTEKKKSAVERFEEQDKKEAPPQDAILFIGSSSIARWNSVGKDMAPLKVINRGISGLTTGAMLPLIPRIVTPYKPRIIVYYCGDNDIAKKSDPDIPLGNFKEFVKTVKKDIPGVQIIYMSIKPSPARWKNWDATKKCNSLIKEYSSSESGITFVDAASCLLGKDESPNTAYYQKDALHLSPEGYAEWTKIIKPILEKFSQKPESK